LKFKEAKEGSTLDATHAASLYATQKWTTLAAVFFKLIKRILKFFSANFVSKHGFVQSTVGF
jgi:hypothetical protein